jgi:hypothetical protein
MACKRRKTDYVAHTGKMNTKTSVQDKGHHYLESQYKEGPHTIKTSEYMQKCTNFNKICF